jgi:tRNA nucleotidyltransferase (CCA-adding enzyme)
VFHAIAAVARETSISAFLVGGPLRDLLLGIRGGDTDIAVEGPPRRFGAKLGRALDGEFTFHPEFDTGTVLLPDGRHIDIARTRTESYPRPAVLPSVTGSTIGPDLARRDFTINALAVRIGKGKGKEEDRRPETGDGRTTDGSISNFQFPISNLQSPEPSTSTSTSTSTSASNALIDPCCGAEDLRNGVIRVLHERSFIDDPTRIFRAARFALRLGFSVEPVTLRLIGEAIDQGLLKLISGKRVLSELRLIAAEPRALPVLRQLNAWGVFASLFGHKLDDRALSRLEEVRTTKYEVRTFVLRASYFVLPLTYLLSLLPDLDRLPLTRSEIADIESLHRFPALRPRLVKARKPSQIHALLRSETRNALAIEAQLESGAIAEKIGIYLDRYSQVSPLLRGADLKALGIEPGPLYTNLLERLRDVRLDRGELTRAQELAMVKRWTGGKVAGDARRTHEESSKFKVQSSNKLQSSNK